MADHLSTPRAGAGVPGRDGVHPRPFSSARVSAADVYLSDPAARKVVEFFAAKGLHALKEEDRREQWYDDWIAYQAEHHLYASVLSPKEHSTLGHQFQLLRYARFLEVFAYCSPAHGYSLQVTFLALFSILTGSNSALKREAVAALEAGGLLAFGVSEKNHGSDLLGNEFTLKAIGPGRFVANGTKYYIGNANCAAIISILARKEDAPRPSGRVRRAVPALFALRPRQSTGYGGARKIRTLGVRAAFVGEFEVTGHEVPEADLIAEGRGAWDAVFGAVTLGKFFLGFGSIGICEHALEEAATHLGRRILFGKPVLEMPHIRYAMAQAYARLAAMKLYAYRALDYVQAANAAERRYLLFCAVQKAKVSTEGVKVMDLLSECIGAKGFESDTYFEMALRDARLVPGLEGSAHLNLGLAARFIPRYFGHAAESDPPDPPDPGSPAAGNGDAGENPYLTQATAAGAFNTVAFPHFQKAYEPLRSVPNVRVFAKQARDFHLFLGGGRMQRLGAEGSEAALALGQCLATIAYAQLVAENAVLFGVAPQIVSAMFHTLVSDLSLAALALAASPRLGATSKVLIRRMAAVPRARAEDWDLVSDRVASYATAPDDAATNPIPHTSSATVGT